MSTASKTRRRVSSGSIELNGTLLPFTLDRGGRKHLYLSVKEGRLTVRAPVAAREEWIRQAMLRKSAWILQKLAQTSRNLPVHPLRDGDQIPILGRLLTVRISRQTGGGARVLRDGDCLLVTLAPRRGQPEQDDPGSADAVEKALDEFRRSLAQEEIPAGFARMQRLTGLCPPRVTLRKMTGSWGRCHADGSITMNFRLVSYPPEVIDYVVLHELCHLVHFSHSREFWALVARYMPDYPAREALLRQPPSFAVQR